MEDKLRPAIELAIARTVLANERSLLAFIRTALGCFLGGAGLFKFFGIMLLSLASLAPGCRGYESVWVISILVIRICFGFRISYFGFPARPG